MVHPYHRNPASLDDHNITPQRIEKKGSGTIQLIVYTCLGPRLSLSVDVLITGLSGVLCVGQNGSAVLTKLRMLVDVCS